ncbi:MAG: HU family DNA-binding protein [Nanoarchaeota archaeon]
MNPWNSRFGEQLNKGETMNKGELVESIAKNTGYPKSQVNETLNEMIGTIEKTVKKRDMKTAQVQLVGLGTFKAVKRKARMGVNPVSGEKIKIPARKTLKFTPSANLKKL